MRPTARLALCSLAVEVLGASVAPWASFWVLFCAPFTHLNASLVRDDAVEKAFRGNVDYGMLSKRHADEAMQKEAKRRYSPATMTIVEKTGCWVTLQRRTSVRNR